MADPASRMADLAGALNATATDSTRYVLVNGQLQTAQDIPTSCTIAQLPATAAMGFEYLVTDLQGGAEKCFWDGTKWRRCSDRSVVN